MPIENFVDDDRRAYGEMLREHCERFAFNVLGYCLMTSTSALIVQCVVKNNAPAWWGGGVSIRGAGSP